MNGRGGPSSDGATVPPDVGRLYRQHADELIRFATVLVGPHEAPDVVTDAVVAASRSARWTEVSEPRAYLFRCVANRATSVRRSDARRAARELRATTSDPGLASDEAPGAGAVAGSVDALRALARLSPQQRAVVYLTYWEDLTPAAVADLLGVGEGSVRKQLARARDQLRTVLR